MMNNVKKVQACLYLIENGYNASEMKTALALLENIVSSLDEVARTSLSPLVESMKDYVKCVVHGTGGNVILDAPRHLREAKRTLRSVKV